MRTKASDRLTINFGAVLEKANGERPRDGSGRFGVDREGRGKAREEAKMGTGEARDQIRDLKNQGKSEEAHALEDHLRRMSNRLGEARARMLPDTMHLHGIRPPVPAKRTMFERPEIIVPKEDSLSKAGTSEGAKLGWESRRGGAAQEPLRMPTKAEQRQAKTWISNAWSNRWDVKDPKKAKAAFASDARVKMDNIADAQGLRNFADALEDENHHDLATEARDRLSRKGYDFEGKPRAHRETFGKEGTSEGAKLGWETRREGGAPEAEKPGEKKPEAEPVSEKPESAHWQAMKKDPTIQAKAPLARAKIEQFSGKTFDDKIKTFASKVNTKSQLELSFARMALASLGLREDHPAVQQVTEAKRKLEAKRLGKSKDEDEDAETEGERETARRRPLPAEARAVMPVGVKKPPRPPGPPQPKQMRVGPRKIEGPRLMPIKTPRISTYMGMDR